MTLCAYKLINIAANETTFNNDGQSTVRCHSKLLQQLCDDFGVRGTALKWIDSYVSNHQQFVKMSQHRLHTVLRSTTRIRSQAVAFFCIHVANC